MTQHIPPYQLDPPNEAGQGTVARRRRNPRMRVEDVAITEASGLALGGDGYPHPLEVDGDGHLKASDRNVVQLLDLIYAELRTIREGLEVNGVITNLVDDEA